MTVKKRERYQLHGCPVAEISTLQGAERWRCWPSCPWIWLSGCALSPPVRHRTLTVRVWHSPSPRRALSTLVWRDQRHPVVRGTDHQAIAFIPRLYHVLIVDYSDKLEVVEVRQLTNPNRHHHIPLSAILSFIYLENSHLLAVTRSWLRSVVRLRQLYDARLVDLIIHQRRAPAFRRDIVRIGSHVHSEGAEWRCLGLYAVTRQLRKSL